MAWWCRDDGVMRLAWINVTGDRLPTIPALQNSPPARSFCDLQVLATSQRILPPFAETPLTSPSHSTTSFVLPNLQPHGPHASASCPHFWLHSIFAPTLYPTLLAPWALPRSICESSPHCLFRACAVPSIFDLSLQSPPLFTGFSPFGLSHDSYAHPSFLFWFTSCPATSLPFVGLGFHFRLALWASLFSFQSCRSAPLFLVPHFISYLHDSCLVLCSLLALFVSF